jgi:hypothetical protein
MKDLTTKGMKIVLTTWQLCEYETFSVSRWGVVWCEFLRVALANLHDAAFAGIPVEVAPAAKFSEKNILLAILADSGLPNHFEEMSTMKKRMERGFERRTML